MTINVNKSKVISILMALILVATILAVIYLFLQQSQTNKYLYEIRDDYYGNTEYGQARMAEATASFETPSDFDENDPANNYSPEFTILSQEVKTLSVPDGYDYDTDEEKFKDSSIRVVKVQIVNDTDSIYNYYEGDVGYTDDNGRITRSTTVSTEDDLNLDDNKEYLTLELAPGGEAEVYLYFVDTGSEIQQLQTYNDYLI